ncbi:MAG: P-loop NTPase fold protein [Caulobacter sp.]|nr:P-loop NTPase fold protein [Caulobacter sp.]
MGLSNDLPIALPDDDRFGLDPFAAALAMSIGTMSAPAGVVLAVNGAWGSGKSSAINLIKHHLGGAVEREELAVIPFNPWWFAGADALTLAFFQELNKAIGPSLPATVRKSLAAIGQGVSAVGAFAGALADLKVPGLGSIISGVAGLVGQVTGLKRTVEEEHRLVADALGKQTKRFLVVIDDIDRLSPDDALTIFRLVKSVGRLPNVIYLLAFDRQIAERIVSERFPSEGPSYLEKIIQGAFEIPPPLIDLLRQQVIETAVAIMGDPGEAKSVRFLNVFYDVVAPSIRTPRDVIRLSNQLSTTWPAVAGNVDRADFLAITALQLSEPAIYDAIRSHPSELCGTRDREQRRQEDIAAEYDRLLCIADRPDRERLRLRVALRRLFPRLDAVWGNMWQNGSGWRQNRLIASAEHFRSYFTFAVSEDVLPADEMDALIERADDAEFVTARFREALTKMRRTGTTQAALLLDELQVFASQIDADKTPSLVRTLFALADELDVRSDKARGFHGMANNQLRIHWVLNLLVHDRFDQAQREAIYRPAMETAALDWAVHFAESCRSFFQARENGSMRDGEPYVSEAVATEFAGIALQKVRDAAADRSLLSHPDLTSLLFSWVRLAGDGAAEVRVWTDEMLGDAAFVVALANALPSESWSFGMGLDEMGDRVSRRSVRVDLTYHRDILDVERLDARVAELIEAAQLSPEQLGQLTAFRDMPRGGHRRGDD